MDKNVQLLDSVINDRLKRALENTDKTDKSFEEAMSAIDRKNELAKTEASSEDLLKKREIETKRQRRDTIIKCIEIAATVIVLPLIDYQVKKSFMYKCCNFEKDYTWTTTPGRSVSSFSTGKSNLYLKKREDFAMPLSFSSQYLQRSL
jgi:hypothetical protein